MMREIVTGQDLLLDWVNDRERVNFINKYTCWKTEVSCLSATILLPALSENALFDFSGEGMWVKKDGVLVVQCFRGSLFFSSGLWAVYNLISSSYCI
jgi:hypothetical protein